MKQIFHVLRFVWKKFLNRATGCAARVFLSFSRTAGPACEMNGDQGVLAV
jgi:hypothetical protein